MYNITHTVFNFPKFYIHFIIVKPLKFDCLTHSHGEKKNWSLCFLCFAADLFSLLSYIRLCAVSDDTQVNLNIFPFKIDCDASTGENPASKIRKETQKNLEMNEKREKNGWSKSEASEWMCRFLSKKSKRVSSLNRYETHTKAKWTNSSM